MLSRGEVRKISLEQVIKEYIPLLEEYPDADNNDWLRPDYSSFYQRREPSLVKKLWYKIFLNRQTTKDNLFQLEYFKELMETVAERRELGGYKPNTIVKIATDREMRFVVWGDIQGALHSLVRTLAQLKEENFIDDSLKIMNEKYYFVFLGDIIDRSPYSMEIITILLQLMAINGEQVIYLRGNHEDKYSWEELDLGKELRTRARYLSSESTPFFELINRFFDTLPRALYLHTKKKDLDQFIRISHDYTQDEFFDEQRYRGFLYAQDKGFTKKDTGDVPSNAQGQDVLLTGIICSESSSKVYRYTDGLKFLPSEKGATVWSPFSSPIRASQELFNFFNDSFSVVDTMDNAERWVITLHKRDVRESTGFVKKKYNFITGAEIPESEEEAKKIQDRLNFSDDIVIGCSLDLSKSSKTAGQRIKNGIELRINQENVIGGIRGKRLKVVFLDDEYTPTLALKNVNSLIEKYHTDILLSPLGAPVNEAFIPLIREDKICVLFPYTGLDSLRDDTLHNVFHFRPAYKQEVRALLDYAIGSLRLNRFAILYQDDAYGLGALDGAKEAFASYGIKEWLEVSYSRNTLNLDLAVSKTMEFNPQAIIFIATYAPAVTFVHKIGVPYLFNKLCLGFSFLTDAFRYFLKKKGLNFIITRVVPNFTGDTPLPLIREYLDEQNKHPYSQDISWDSLEGYINASIFIEALKQIPEPITKEKLVDFLENLHSTDLKGLQLDFDPTIRGFGKNLLVDTGAELLPWTAPKKETPMK